MKHNIQILFFVPFFIIGSSLLIQAQPIAVSPKVYQTAIENELTKYGGSRYLYEHADAYQRLIQFRAMKRMGYDLEEHNNTETPILNQGTIIDTTFSKDITSTGTSDQDETTIAISRTNQNIIVAGANDVPGMNSGMPAYYTIDRGNRWTTSRIPKPPPLNGVSMLILGDPAVIADDSGHFYYAYLTGPNDQSSQDNIVVATSIDGKKWTNGGYIVPVDSMVGFEDKENICIDHSPASPHYGRLYVVWLHFNDPTGQFGGGGRISWSDDKGKTWSIPKAVTDSLIRFSEVRTGKRGEVFFTFSIVDDANQTGSHLFLSSTDGGKNFRMNSISDFVLYPARAIDSRPALKGDGGFRAFPYIAHDVDIKTNRIHLVYSTWYGDISGVNLPAAELLYVSSTDLGTTWTPPLPLGISNPAFSTLNHDRFSPWVSVNQKTGDAYCSYYSSERDTNNTLIAAFRTKLTNTLHDYQIPLEQSDFDATLLTKAQSFSGQLVPFIGDYQGSDCYDSVYAAAWTEGLNDQRNDGDVYVYIESPSLPTVTGGVSVLIKSNNLWLSAPSPNPVSGGRIRFSYYFPAACKAEIALYTTTGIKVKTFTSEIFESGTYTNQYGLEGLPSGKYILRLSTNYGDIEKSIVIMK